MSEEECLPALFWLEDQLSRRLTGYCSYLFSPYLV
jgi:hypothetical protein